MALVLIRKVVGVLLRERVLAWPNDVWVAQLVRAAACRAGDPGLNPDPDDNFFS